MGGIMMENKRIIKKGSKKVDGGWDKRKERRNKKLKEWRKKNLENMGKGKIGEEIYREERKKKKKRRRWNWKRIGKEERSLEKRNKRKVENNWRRIDEIRSIGIGKDKER